MKQNLLQKEVAETLNVNEMTVTNWENNRNNIQTRHFPSVIDFLGFIPEIIKDFKPLQSKVFLTRCEYGITQKEMAQRLGIDQSTLHAIEWGKRNASRSTLEKMKLT